MKGRLYMNRAGAGQRSTQKASSANSPSLPSARRFLIVMDPRERSDHGLPNIGRSLCKI